VNSLIVYFVELDDLKLNEKRLDQLIKTCNEDLEAITKHPWNEKYPFVVLENVCAAVYAF